MHGPPNSGALLQNLVKWLGIYHMFIKAIIIIGHMICQTYSAVTVLSIINWCTCQWQFPHQQHVGMGVPVPPFMDTTILMSCRDSWIEMLGQSSIWSGPTCSWKPRAVLHVWFSGAARTKVGGPRELGLVPG